jgi:hypothetical protein
MIGAHPLVGWASEMEFLVDAMNDAGDWPDLGAYYASLSADRIFLDSGLRIDTTLSYPDLMQSFLQQRKERWGRPFIVAAVHRCFDRLLRLFPDARFIHLVRDPRDVARSNVAMGWVGNVWAGAARWIDAEVLWNRLRAIVPESRRLEIVYERLIEAPESELSRICKFIGVQYDAAMLSYPSDTTYEAPDPKMLYQWRRKLSTREIRLVEHRVSSLLEDRGFSRSGLPPLRASAAREFWLRVGDRWGRMRYAQEMLGTRLWFERAISNRLGGPKTWRASIQHRIHAKYRSLLK